MAGCEATTDGGGRSPHPGHRRLSSVGANPEHFRRLVEGSQVSFDRF
jgi:hypothetical protein